MNPHDTDIPATEVVAQRKTQRYVYNGESPLTGADNILRGNRPITKRKRSPFNIIVTIVAVSLLIVFYVWNKITVNHLAVEINDLQIERQKIQYANEILRAEISRKSSLERIGRIATDKLGMEYTRIQPRTLSLDNEQLELYQSHSK